MATIGSAFVEIGANTGKFDAAINAVDRKLKDFGKQNAKLFKSIGENLTLGVTTPIVGLGAKILQTAGNFEKAMNGVKAITQATGAEFEALTNKAEQLGATTQFSATEAAAGIETLARNGLNATQILAGAADASLALAAATGTDLANAADIATDAMLQFGFKATELDGVINKITGATVNSKFSIDDMRLALAQAGGVAGKVGVSFSDFTAGIAATSSAFSSGADAGTSFKTFLTTLAPKTKEAVNLQQKLKLEFFDSAGNMKSMSEIAGILEKSFSGLTEQQKIQYSQTLFGTDAMRTALTLADTGAAKFDKLAESIGKVSASEQAKIRMQGFNGAMKTLSSAFEAVQIAIAKSGLLDFFTMFVNKVTGVLQAISRLNPKLLSIVTIVAAIAAAVGPVVFIFAKLKLVFAALGIAAAPLALKIAAITAAVVGLVIIGRAIYDSWEPIAAFFARLWANITKTFALSLLKIITGVEEFSSVLGIKFDGAKEAITGFYNDAVSTLNSTPPVTFTAALGSIADNVKSTFVGLKSVVSEGMAGLTGDGGTLTAPSIGTPAGGMGGAMGAGATGTPTPIDSLNMGLSLVSTNAETAKMALTSSLTTITGAIGTTTTATQALTQAWEKANGQQFVFKDAINSTVAGFGLQATQIGKNAKGLKDYSKQLLNTAKSNISALIAEGVAAAVRGALIKVPFPANIAIAGVAGGAAAALFNYIIPNFAKGGVVSGETIARVGEYAGARSNPEVIAPLDKLNSIIGNNSGGGISADDLNAAFERQKITINSSIGMTEIQREAGRTQYIARKGTFTA